MILVCGLKFLYMWWLKFISLNGLFLFLVLVMYLLMLFMLLILSSMVSIVSLVLLCVGFYSVVMWDWT